MSVVARARYVAEEVRLAPGTGRIERRRLLAQPLEHLGERCLDARLLTGKAVTFDQAEAGLLEVHELLGKLLEPKRPLQRRQECVELRSQPAGLAQRPTEQGEARIDARLLARHAGGSAVVGARIGDAAADHLAALVEEDRLCGRRAEVDADESLHGLPLPHAAARAPARFCSIIWK